jgi:hypothetical protein
MVSKNVRVCSCVAVFCLSILIVGLMWFAKGTQESVNVPAETYEAIGEDVNRNPEFLPAGKLPEKRTFVKGATLDSSENNSLLDTNVKKGADISKRYSSGVSIELPLPDLSSDLSPQEIEQALDVFSQERAMCAKIKNLRGEVEIRISEDEIINGIIQIRKCEVEGEPIRGFSWTYELVIVGKENNCEFISDGTRDKTEIRCDDAELSEKLNTVLSHNTVE